MQGNWIDPQPVHIVNEGPLIELDESHGSLYINHTLIPLSKPRYFYNGSILNRDVYMPKDEPVIKPVEIKMHKIDIPKQPEIKIETQKPLEIKLKFDEPKIKIEKLFGTEIKFNY